MPDKSNISMKYMCENYFTITSPIIMLLLQLYLLMILMLWKSKFHVLLHLNMYYNNWFMKTIKMIIKFMKFMLLMFLLFMLFIEFNVVKWMLLEMFTILFIGIFMNSETENKYSSLIYYCISSIIGLILFAMLMLQFNYWSWELLNEIDPDKFIITKIIQFLFLMKLGTFPYQIWMTEILPQMSWKNIFLFVTINKMMPMFLLVSMSSFKDPIFLYCIMLNSVMSTLMATNQNSFKKVMAFSSMNHTSFLILLTYLNTPLTFIYFICYTINTSIFVLLLNYLNADSKTEMLKVPRSKLMDFLFTCFTISYCMLPPFMFFIIKWFFFYEITMSNSTNFFLIVIMISSVLMTYNYLDLMKFTSFHMKFLKKHVMLHNLFLKYTNMCIFFIILINVLIFSIFFF